MCLAVPGKVISIDDSGALRMGVVDFGGVEMDICMEFLPEAGAGDYVLAHVGTALTLLSEEDAKETLAALRELGEASALPDSVE
jgi:hydrogenase expression/formation protein HypC